MARRWQWRRWRRPLRVLVEMPQDGPRAVVKVFTMGRDRQDVPAHLVLLHAHEYLLRWEPEAVDGEGRKSPAGWYVWTR